MAEPSRNRSHLDGPPSTAASNEIIGASPTDHVATAVQPSLTQPGGAEHRERPRHWSDCLRCWLPFLLPFGVLLAVLGFSPNFQWLEAQPGQPLPFRENPYGGDFLQDWVGGKIASQPNDRNLLYQSDYANQLQHSSLVGFSWSEEKYFPMVYPPYYYWLVSPFSRLSYRWSAIVWTVLSAGAFVLAGWLLYLSHSPLRMQSWPLMLAMTAFVPWIIALSMGQKSTWLLLFFVAAYGLFVRDQKFLAGMVFGLVAIKPQLGIVVGFAMYLNRQWSFVTGAAVTVLGLLILAACLNDVWFKEYEAVVRNMGDYAATEGYQLHDAHSIAGGLKMLFPSSSNWSFPIVMIVSAILTLVVSWDWSVLRNHHQYPELAALQFSNLIFASVLVSPHLYTYDLTILLLPIVLVVTTLRHPSGSGAGKSFKAEGQKDITSDSNPSSMGAANPSEIMVQALVLMMFVLAGLLPKLNLATQIPWGMLLILAITLGLSWHLRHNHPERIPRLEPGARASDSIS